MKKILFIETGIDGHHLAYLKGLVNNCKKFEKYIYSPEYINDLDIKQEVHYIDFKQKKYRDYRRWILHAIEYAKKNSIDIIHFLDGDTIMRYMGNLFWKFGEKTIIITYHHYFEGYLRRLSYRKMTQRCKYAVVHTELIKKKFSQIKINNIKHIEYPVFSYDSMKKLESAECKKYFNLPTNVPVFGCIGATDSYKGTRVFLKALKKIDLKLCVFFAGKESDVKSKEIDDYNFDNNIQVIKKFEWLSELDYIKAICACDYLVLPYTDKFNGASGPLADAVIAGKCIIGSDYASLGESIQENKLGYTFKVNDADDLADIIKNVIRNPEKYNYCNSKRNKYCDELKPARFYDSYNKIYFSAIESHK